ncbi:MAG: DNA alkylation repair protein [Pseudomonadota bacterium]
MDTIEELIQRVQKTQHGFTDIRRVADEVVGSGTTHDSLRVATRLLASEVHQARMLATLVCGRLAAQSDDSLNLLRSRVSKDGDWRVQEMLAQAFDRYCADMGYERALPVIEDWLADSNPNVRRAAAEGLRVWTRKPYFRDHPDTATRLLSQLRDDDSEYVRKSVGNALRDISRKHKALVKAELETWKMASKGIEQTYKLASKFL